MSAMVYTWSKHEANSRGQAVACDVEQRTNAVLILQQLGLAVAIIPGYVGMVIVLDLKPGDLYAERSSDGYYVSKIVHLMLEWKLGIWNSSSVTYSDEGFPRWGGYDEMVRCV